MNRKKIRIIASKINYSVDKLKTPIYNRRKKIKNKTWKQKIMLLKKKTGKINLHLGCGNKHYDNMINCEYRATKAADIVMDCSKLKPFKIETIDLIYAHAFLEHIYRDQHKEFMKECFRTLNKKGILMILAIPDFKKIAETYLKKEKNRNNKFDLFEVYRYTHGNPEMTPSYWLEQLHKSLFDKEYVKQMLKDAGFKQIKIFSYRYPKEKIPLNIGFFASKTTKVSKNQAKELLDQFSNEIRDIKEIIKQI